MKKFVSKILIAALLIAVLLPVRVFADTEAVFELQVDGTGVVTLVSSNAKDVGTSSLQFSLSVSGANVANAEFVFSETVLNTAKVCESRYEQGTLNVYISGIAALFSDTRLNVGKAVAYDASKNVVAASVRAVTGSVKYVYGDELKSQPTPSPTPTPTPGGGSSWGGGGGSWQPLPTLTPTPTVEVTPEPTATPTPTSTPTPTPTGPQMYTSLRLYYEGDVTGKYAAERYAVVWNKDGYTVQFKSGNSEIATVGKNKGLVTAVSVGTTRVTATFTDMETGEQIIKRCKVTVKRNAVDAGISANSAKKLLNLTVGDSVQTITYRKDSDGNVAWTGRDQITDSARFISSNTDVFTVGKTKGKVTAVGAGEAILTVWAVQSEGATYDEDGNVVEYRATTVPREYKVIVKEAETQEE